MNLKGKIMGSKAEDQYKLGKEFGIEGKWAEERVYAIYTHVRDYVADPDVFTDAVYIDYGDLFHNNPEFDALIRTYREFKERFRTIEYNPVEWLKLYDELKAWRENVLRPTRKKIVARAGIPA